MKKCIALILTLAAILSLLAACGSAESKPTSGETTADPGNDTLLVGYAAVNITPEGSVPLAGYGRTLTRMSTGTLSYLFITCTAITGTNGETILNYGMDLIGGSEAYSFASKVTEATGVPEKNIIMSASHTHSAPDFSHDQLKTVQDFRQNLGVALVKAAEQAMANRCPAEMYIATVQTEGLNFVRRYVLENGTYAGDNYGDFSSSPIASHESEVDNTMQLVKFVREGDKDVILANFQTHPHRTGGTTRYDLSADIVGRFRDTLSAKLDCYVSYFTGGSGNVNPTSRVEEENIYADWKAHGDALADAAFSAEGSYVKVEGTKVQATSVTYTGTINHTEDHLVDKAREVQEYYNNGGTWSGAMEMGKEYGILGAFHAGAIITKSQRPATQDVPIFAHSVGNVAFVAAPYEMFDTNGMEVKENSPFEMTLIMTCANGSVGYMPSALGWEHGGYSVQTSRFVSGTAEAFVAEYLGMLNALYETKD